MHTALLIISMVPALSSSANHNLNKSQYASAATLAAQYTFLWLHKISEISVLKTSGTLFSSIASSIEKSSSVISSTEKVLLPSAIVNIG